MAFTLRITFSGLCLFVADGEAGATTGRMHVLLPGMFAHHHCGPNRHVAALGYDTGALAPGGTLTGVTALARLAGHALTFGGGDTASLRLCSQIPDLREITGRGVDPDVLDADDEQRLAARVTLAAGGITRVAQGVCWEWRPGEYRPIANRVEWEIPDVEGDSLTIVATTLGGGGGTRPLGTLYPTNGRLSLMIYHDTSENMPPDPLPAEHQPALNVGDATPHFAAYYGVFSGDVQPVLPRFHGPADSCPPPEGACAILPPDMGGSAYLCVVGGVSAGGGGGGGGD